MGKTLEKPWQIILFGIINLVIGLALLFYSKTFIEDNKNKYNTYIQTEAIVVSYDYTYDYDDNELTELVHSVVEYEVNDKLYKVTANNSSTTKEPLGKIITIYYNPNNPSEAIFEKEKYNVYIMPILGFIFSIVGLILIIKSIIKSIKN